MNMTYRIEENRQYGSHEVYFDGKPADAVRAALKALKFRWNGKKSCWYGFADESAIIAAILGTNTDDTDPENAAGVVTDGYMGGRAYYGPKSGKALYGADLSAAIRADVKRAGLKGVTISCKSYSGGQLIRAKVKTTAEDVKPWAEFLAGYSVSPSGYCLDCLSESGTWYTKSRDEYFCSMTAEEQTRTRTDAARGEWQRETQKSNSVNQYHLEAYTSFTDRFLEKLRLLNDIINAYRFDESNAMVDYVNTNFYYDIITVPAA